MWLDGGEPETSIGAMAAFQSPPAETISYKNKWPGNRTKNKAPGTFAGLQTRPAGPSPASYRLSRPDLADVEDHTSQGASPARSTGSGGPGQQQGWGEWGRVPGSAEHPLAWLRAHPGRAPAVCPSWAGWSPIQRHPVIPILQPRK